MEYMSAKDAAHKWGISQRRVATLCSEKRIGGATIVGNMWIIPRAAVKPADARTSRYNEIDDTRIKPFLKWAGGKSQLLDEVTRYYPFADASITKYAEPFVGGGAVLFNVLRTYRLKEVYISDINAELINAYVVLRDNATTLIAMLKDMQHEFIPLSVELRKQYYLKKRARFNELKLCESKQNSSANVEKAALLIFLNKTCFNGLYRVNKKGLFNVPMGSYKNPIICSEHNLHAVSQALKHVAIVCGDYKESDRFIDDHTFVYFDPPYRPLTRTASFTAYTDACFDDAKQLELASFVQEMSNKGAKILVSNSDPKNADATDTFMDEAYSNYTITRVRAARMINSKGSARSKINELLISNDRSNNEM